MSQSTQSHATAAAPAGTAQEADTLVDAYAEDLMDEIFDDVDRILAGEEAAIYAEAARPLQGTSTLLTPDAVTVPALLVPGTAEHMVEGSASAYLTEKAAGATDAEPQEQSSSQPDKKRRWGRFMVGALGLSALAAVGIWWMRQQPTLQSATAVPAAPAPTVPTEVAFGDYLKRSLRVISGERSAQTETQTPSAVATAPAQSANNQAANNQASGQPANVIERVFVPLLQPGSGTTPNRPNVVTLPTLPAPSPANPPDQTNNAPAPAPTVSNAPNIAANNTYELVGVLELGDRSAALFEINGSSQRVYIGETIGGSGWSIVSINNEEVVVRRNGEVRSIYIGQQF